MAKYLMCQPLISLPQVEPVYLRTFYSQTRTVYLNPDLILPRMMGWWDHCWSWEVDLGWDLKEAGRKYWFDVRTRSEHFYACSKTSKKSPAEKKNCIADNQSCLQVSLRWSPALSTMESMPTGCYCHHHQRWQPGWYLTSPWVGSPSLWPWQAKTFLYNAFIPGLADQTVYQS